MKRMSRYFEIWNYFLHLSVKSTIVEQFDIKKKNFWLIPKLWVFISIQVSRKFWKWPHSSQNWNVFAMLSSFHQYSDNFLLWITKGFAFHWPLQLWIIQLGLIHRETLLHKIIYVSFALQFRICGISSFSRKLVQNDPSPQQNFKFQFNSRCIDASTQHRQYFIPGLYFSAVFWNANWKHIFNYL